MPALPSQPLVAIACGGTGGPLFPGLAVAAELVRRGCDVTLLISPKEVDQQGVRSAVGLEIVTLPAMGLSRGRLFGFLRGFWRSYRAAKRTFHARPPQAVLAMGGFTSAPPVLAGKGCGAATFLHESNIIPGKANRWLAHVVDQAFVGFPSAAGRLFHRNAITTGTPVRPQFQPGDAGGCRLALGLDPERPVLLVTGGSQGASALNDLVLQALPALAQSVADLQWVHLTGVTDFENVRRRYAAQNCKAVVRPFLTEMELALGAATVGVSRSGASSLAELAAMRLPAILIPYPAAADSHQWYNARALVDAGAALLLEQTHATGEKLAALVLKLLQDKAACAAMARELIRWHSPRAAEAIAEKILLLLNARHSWRWKALSNPEPSSPPRQNTNDHGVQAASPPRQDSSDPTLSVPA
jgi:UDP-N-acetylglucosamine--N-acetylmuramyl-(pentapeptide) pyrophosphoryl-undecaprenol N-acetylglucosamine transferase